MGNKKVVDINSIQAIYDAAKTTFTSKDKVLLAINREIEKLTADPTAKEKLASMQTEQKAIENQLFDLTGIITTLNKFVNEAAGTPLGEAKQLTLVKGDGTFKATDVKNTKSLADVTTLVTAYDGGISSQPSLETIIDSLKASPVGSRSGYQAHETEKVEAARLKYVAPGGTLADLKAYAESVQTQLGSYSALDTDQLNKLLTTTLNGSWERTAITTLNSNISTEATAREAADLAEVTARNGAIGSAIATEATARGAADTVLGGRITTEANARGAADTALGGRITTEATDREAADLAEADAREAADKALGGRITTEATDRGVADTALGYRITTEVTNREAADLAEADAREAADTVLGGRITTEATAREAADTALGGRITGEATGRVAAINAERAARIDAINTERAARIDAINAEAQRAIDAEQAITLKLENHKLQLTDHGTRLISAESKLFNHETRLMSAESNIQRLNRGIAMTAALVTPMIESGNNNAVAFNAAGYEGDTGFSLGYARRISGGFSANLSVASSDQFEETVVRGGVNFSW